MKSLLRKIKHLIEYVIIALLFKIFKQLGYEKSSYYMGKITEGIIKHMNIFKRICSDIESSSISIPASKVKKIALASINNFGRYIAEFQFIHSWTEAELKKHVKVVGIENLEGISKKPSLVLTSHHANWEVIVRYFYFRKEKVRVVNRSMNNPYVNNLIFKIRSHKKDFDYIDKNNASKKTY